jgi:hypothetical protein
VTFTGVTREKTSVYEVARLLGELGFEIAGFARGTMPNNDALWFQRTVKQGGSQHSRAIIWDGGWPK